MVDMGQADRSLRHNKNGKGRCPFAWLFAIAKAAKEMGYAHCYDVPDERVPEMREKADKLLIA